ncbi:MAG: hypothetical protein U0821_23625 [Chloroflexota bacterium]
MVEEAADGGVALGLGLTELDLGDRLGLLPAMDDLEDGGGGLAWLRGWIVGEDA